MPIKIGYLLPTREFVMAGQHAALPTIELAERAEAVGLDSVWIGDSVTAKPRHDPMTMLAAIAARTKRVSLGTAVLLPVLRNPVLLAHQLATLDQISEGRLIVGIGIGNALPPGQAEFKAVGVPFEKRVGRLIEGFQLCKALWTGEPVTWDGRWTLENAVLGPKPFTAGGPPIWGGGSAAGALKRAAKYFDGWYPSGPSDSAIWTEQWNEVLGHAKDAGRKADDLTGAAYLTLAVGDDEREANARLDAYLERYYNQPADVIRQRQGVFAGTQAGAVDWLQGFVQGGGRHFTLRLVGDHARNLDIAAAMRADLQSS